MVKSKKSTALNNETRLENALKKDNVIDMRLFFNIITNLMITGCLR